MKRIALSLLLASVLFLAVPVGAQTARPSQLDYIDAQLDVFTPRLADFQANYLAANGVYFQALVSHATPPAGVAPADNLYAAPTDQAVALATLWVFADLPAEIGWSYRVDTYYGPDGPGYVLTAEASIDGQRWIRSENYGPDAWRAAPWYPFVDEF
jgi:hypothetical protein